MDTESSTERNEAFEGADGGAPLVTIMADEVRLGRKKVEESEGEERSIR